MKALAGMACVLALCACRAEPTPDPKAVATRFVQALNAKDVDAMAREAAAPFTFQNQVWESARDGSGYVLGATQTATADSTAALPALLRTLTAQVQIESTTPVAAPPPRADLLRDPLGGSPAWNDLDVVLFVRGQGDVEHIGIVGVHAPTGRVRAVYVN